MVSLIFLGISPFLLLPQHSSDQEEKSILAVKQLGGRIEYEDGTPGRPVIAVFLVGCLPSADDLQKLAAFTRLRKLEIGSNKLTRDCIKELVRFKELQMLDLTATDLSDEAMEDLASIRSLKALDLTGSKFSNKGLRTISQRV
jgi:hypothetical protein